MSLAEAVLEIAADMEAAASKDRSFQSKDVEYWAKMLRAVVKATEVKPVFRGPSSQPPPEVVRELEKALAGAFGGSDAQIIPLGAVSLPFGPEWLKEQEKKNERNQARRELRDKADFAESCSRTLQGNPLHFFADGPLEGDSMHLPPRTPAGHLHPYTDPGGRQFTYVLKEDRKFHLLTENEPVG